MTLDRLVDLELAEELLLGGRMGDQLEELGRHGVEEMDRLGPALVLVGGSGAMLLSDLGEVIVQASQQVGADDVFCWVAAARDRLAAETKANLRGRLDIEESELTSIIALVRSRIDLSLSRILAPEAEQP